MSKEHPTFVELVDAFRAAVEVIGYVGSVEIREGGCTANFWVGKPGGKDKQIVITIDDLPEDPRPAVPGQQEGTDE